MRRLYPYIAILTIITFAAYPFSRVLAAEVLVATSISIVPTDIPASSPQMVWISDTKGYAFWQTGGSFRYASTTDGGATWKSGTVVDEVNSADTVSGAVWYDGWTPGSTTTPRYIHVATLDSGVDDTYYTRIDTQTDTKSVSALGTTQAASATAGANHVSITMSATGTLFMASADTSDSWVVGCSVTCTTAGNWREIPNTTASSSRAFNTIGDDVPILLPVGSTSATRLTYWDTSANAIVSNIYSGTSSDWWGFSTTTGIDDNATYEAQSIGAAINPITGTSTLVVVDDANDFVTADHDILFYHDNGSTTFDWSPNADVLNGASGITAAKIAWDTLNTRLYVAYGLRSTISNASTTNIYYKTSDDLGSNWSVQSSAVNTNASDMNGISLPNSSDERIGVKWTYNDATAGFEDDTYYADIVDITTGGGGAPDDPGKHIRVENANIILRDADYRIVN